MSKIEKYLSAILSLAFTLGVFLFFNAKYAGHLHFQEQNQLFEATFGYFREVCSLPGGFADWAGRYLTQFCYAGWPGALGIALLLCLVQLLCYAVSGKKSLVAYAFSFAAPVILTVFLLDDKALTGSIAAIALCLGGVLLIKSLNKGLLRTILTLALIPALYWSCGPLVIIYALCLPADEHLGVRIAAPLLALAFPLISVLFLHCPLPRLMTGVHYYRFPQTIPSVLWIGALAAVLYYWGTRLNTKSAVSSWKKTVAGLLSACVIALAGMCLINGKADMSSETMMKYDWLLRCGDWDGIIKEASLKMPDKPLSVSALNLALAMTGNMSERMFCYLQSGSAGLFPAYSISYTTLLPTSEIFWQLAMTNACQEYTFESQEAIPDFQKSARCYLRLAETNLVNGDAKVAMKYARTLEKTRYYSKAAKEIELLAGNDSLVDAHPVYGRMRALHATDRVCLFNENDKASMLSQLLDVNPDNSLAEEYMLNLYLLEKDMDTFSAALGGISRGTLPKHWQEALLLQCVSHGYDLAEVDARISADNSARMLDFVKDIKSSKNQGYMHRTYGDTYWYYCIYR